MACLPGLATALEVNGWSLAYLWEKTGRPMESAPLTTPPPAHARAPLWLARDALVDGDPRAALEWLDPGVRGGVPEALSLQGRALEADGDLEAAIGAWQRAGDFRALVDTAARVNGQGRTSEAEAAYRAAYAMDPERGATYLAGFLISSARSPAAAEAMLIQTLAAFPNSTNRGQWLMRLADIRRSQQRWEGAIEAYQQALILQGVKVQAHIGLGWVFFQGLNDPKAAEAEFQLAMQIAPERGEGYYAMGDLRDRQQEYTEAEGWFLQAVERSPNNRWWQLARANAVRAGGDLPRALTLYEAVTAQFPEFGEAHFNLALVYEGLGDLPNAARSMDRALEWMSAPTAWHFEQAARVYAAAGQ